MRRGPLSHLFSGAALALLLAGCGRSPVSPRAALPGEPGASAAWGSHADDPPAPVQGQPGANATLMVEANGEGTVSVGRFTLTIHKNSLTMPATITLTVPEPDAMQVEIEVSPAEANEFQVPIELVADLSDRPDVNLDSQTIFWWEGAWQEAQEVAVQRASRQLVARTQRLVGAKLDERVRAGIGRTME